MGQAYPCSCKVHGVSPCCRARSWGCLDLQGEGVWEVTTGCLWSLALVPGPGRRKGPLWGSFAVGGGDWTRVLDISRGRGVVQHRARAEGWSGERKTPFSLPPHPASFSLASADKGSGCGFLALSKRRTGQPGRLSPRTWVGVSNSTCPYAISSMQ